MIWLWFINGVFKGGLQGFKAKYLKERAEFRSVAGSLAGFRGDRCDYSE